jgi:hypothetical protein
MGLMRMAEPGEPPKCEHGEFRDECLECDAEEKASGAYGLRCPDGWHDWPPVPREGVPHFCSKCGAVRLWIH